MGVAVNPYKNTLTEKDFISGNTVLTAGKFIEVGRLKVPAGVAHSLGYGTLAGQDSANGRIYGVFKTAADAVVEGKVRFELLNPQDRPIQTLFECRTEELNTVANDKTKQTPFPDTMVQVGRDHSIVLMFMPDANATLDATKCDLKVDATTFDVIG